MTHGTHVELWSSRQFGVYVKDRHLEEMLQATRTALCSIYAFRPSNTSLCLSFDQRRYAMDKNKLGEIVECPFHPRCGTERFFFSRLFSRSRWDLVQTNKVYLRMIVDLKYELKLDTNSSVFIDRREERERERESGGGGEKYFSP